MHSFNKVYVLGDKKWVNYQLPLCVTAVLVCVCAGTVENEECKSFELGTDETWSKNKCEVLLSEHVLYFLS